MNNFIFENATKVLFGKGCVKEYLCCLIKGCGDTVMLAYGGGSIKKNGVYDEVVSILKEAGKHIVEFPGIMANPTYAKVLEGAKLARESQAGLILGVGGGSVMDCCKAVSIAARYDGDVWEDFWARPGIFDFEPLPLGVIVTVAGTGSECNGGAVITNEEAAVDVFDCQQGQAAPGAEVDIPAREEEDFPQQADAELFRRVIIDDELPEELPEAGDDFPVDADVPPPVQGEACGFCEGAGLEARIVHPEIGGLPPAGVLIVVSRLKDHHVPRHEAAVLQKHLSI